MKGSTTRKPSNTSPASTTTTMSRRSHDADTKSSMVCSVSGGTLFEAAGVGGEHGERQQYAGEERQRAPQVEVGGRQQRLQGAVLVQPPAAKADHQDRKPALPAHDHRDAPQKRRHERE